jgi:hypothetical protein
LKSSPIRNLNKYRNVDWLHEPTPRRQTIINWPAVLCVVLTLAVAGLMFGFAVLRFGL